MSLTHRSLLIVLALGLALAIFAIDLFSALDGAIAVLHVIVVLLLAPLGRRFVVLAGLCTTALACIAFVGGHLGGATEGALSRFGVSLVAIGSTTLLSLRDRSTRTTLSEQARLLELSHDTVIIRDRDDIILHWNDGARDLYGWLAEEAIGRRCDDLLKDRLPAHEIQEALAADGQWSGEIVRTRRDGTRLVLASRWLLRRDPEGRQIGIIESSADLTEQRQADAERAASEERFRIMFENAGFAAWESDWSETMAQARAAVPAGEDASRWLSSHPDLAEQAIGLAVVRNANQAAVDLFGVASAEALVGGNLAAYYLPDSARAIASILGTLTGSALTGGALAGSALTGGAPGAEAETHFVSASGRRADVVLRVTPLPSGAPWSHVLVTAFDVTERNEARARLEQTSAELAHAARVSMLGQLAASIAHEVNQPLAAIINYGKSGKRWLSRPEPELSEVAECLERIVANGTRAADVIGRVRALARKAPPQAEMLDPRLLVEDAIALIQREARAADVTIWQTLPDALPVVLADRVQVQQVLVNLLMNGIQAMRGVEGRPRDLRIAIEPQVDGVVRLAVADTGVGLPEGLPERIFEPFFSTRSDGMGMGLSICRSIIEAQGGRIVAANNPGAGATVAFTLPTAPRGEAPHAVAARAAVPSADPIS